MTSLPPRPSASLPPRTAAAYRRGVSIPSDETYIQAWRERQARDAQAAAQWRRARMDEVERAARRLLSELGVSSVRLIGSLARGTARPGSDIDLWIEGLPENEWLTAVAVARAEIAHAEVDLIRAEWAGPEMAARAASEGIVLDGH